MWERYVLCLQVSCKSRANVFSLPQQMTRIFDNPERFDISEPEYVTAGYVKSIMEDIIDAWTKARVPYDTNSGYYVVKKTFAIKYRDPSVLCHTAVVESLATFQTHVLGNL